MSDDNFYIGWKDSMSTENSGFLKKILIPVFILLPLLIFALVKLEKPYNDFQFELGQLKEFTGIYQAYPFPMLEVSKDQVADGFSNNILLVGYGKFGAEGIMNNLSWSGNLDGKKITLQGTLIFGDGKTLLELTKKEKSLINVEEDVHNVVRKKEDLGLKSISGEILDPKCYFGVMKPGLGKIHKSCAIRCISGGIPPVFREETRKGFAYYLILDEKGEKINQELLPYVAENINISGKSQRINDWNIIYINPNEIIRNL